ncbi:hypothetical protein Q5P01_021999 [Channa striata]|uniref:Uncharacterized protein n=1 Tax=Channa striata TaxID=64152 RepID=A0AA88IX60_CHASR|nr:hypothetical protein Q5P01_021999 [Channa striata]
MLNADLKQRINVNEALMNHFITTSNICTCINLFTLLNTEPFCFLRLIWQLEELSEEFKSSITSKHSDDNSTAGTSQKPPQTSSVSVTHNSDVNTGERTKGFVQGRKRFWKIIPKFFS